MAEETEVAEKRINVLLTPEAHRNLKVLCAAWMVDQGEALSRLLTGREISEAVERLR